MKHSPKQFVWRWLTERLHLDWRLRSGLPTVIRSYSDWCTYNEIFVNGEYSDAIHDAISADKERICVLDLGANVGYFTLMLADTFLRERPAGKLCVRLVEASPSVAHELERRLDLANDRLDVGIRCGLAGQREGSAVLNFAKEDNQHFVGNESGSWRAARGSKRMPYVDLEALATEAGMTEIDLIKCDIEGSEFAFVKAYPDLLRKALRIVIEVHTAFGDEQQLSADLKGLGFSLCSAIRESAALRILYFSRI